MAWALRFDGVNDYASTPLSGTLTATGYIEFKYSSTSMSRQNIIDGFGESEPFRIASLNYKPGTGGDSPGFIGMSMHHSQSSRGYVNIGAELYDGLPHIIRVEYDTSVSTDTYKVFFDGVEKSVTIISARNWTPGTYSYFDIGTEERSNYFFDGDLEWLDVGFLAGPAYYDATASSHTAGTPVLTDTIGGNNATGVNMPTDGSAWVDLGGGDENSASIASNMPSLLSSAAFSHVAPVGFNASISSTLPSLTSSANFTQTLPEFDASVSSNMPSLLSAGNLTNTAPNYDAGIASVMPSMISDSNVTVTAPQSGAAIASTMPSLVSSGNFTQELPAAGVVISSTMPSMVSASVFAQAVPEFDGSIASTMPSMVSSSTIQNLTPGNNSAIASIMPALTSSATLVVDEPVTLDTTIASTMPSLQTSATVYNGVISVVIGEGNNINIVVKSRNLNILTKSRDI